MNQPKIYSMLILFVMCACHNPQALIPTYNNGGYEFTKAKSSSLIMQDSILIIGQLFDLENSDQSMTATVQFGCIKVNSDNGHYRISSRPFDDMYQVVATSIGYLKIETKPFKTDPGDSIIINFYLEEDKRPLINCEGY